MTMRLLLVIFAAGTLTAAIPVQAAVAMAPAPCRQATRFNPPFVRPPPPFANETPELGKPLNDKACVGCHARRFGGDADQVYFRSGRRGGAAAGRRGARGASLR